MWLGGLAAVATAGEVEWRGAHEDLAPGAAIVAGDAVYAVTWLPGVVVVGVRCRALREWRWVRQAAGAAEWVVPEIEFAGR